MKLCDLRLNKWCYLFLLKKIINDTENKEKIKRAINGLNNLKNPCSSTNNISIKAIDTTGAISDDPGLINHTEKLRLKISKKEKTFKIFCSKNKLIK